MVVIGNIWQVLDEQEYMEQKCVNVYFYHDTTPLGSGTAFELAALFLSEVQPGIVECQNNLVTHTGLTVKSLFDPDDRYAVAYSSPGLLAHGDGAMPTFNAWAFRMNTNTGSVRPGHKRIVGLREQDTAGGAANGATIASALTVAAAAMGLALDGSTWGSAYVPVVVKRILTPLGYALPENTLDAVFARVVSVAWEALITSQVSRKIGLGV